jgi:hypothetical protein
MPELNLSTQRAHAITLYFQMSLTHKPMFVGLFWFWLALNGPIAAQVTPLSESIVLHTESRARTISAELYFRSDASGCRGNKICSVALVSGGYRQIPTLTRQRGISFVCKRE